MSGESYTKNLVDFGAIPEPLKETISKLDGFFTEDISELNYLYDAWLESNFTPLQIGNRSAIGMSRATFTFHDKTGEGVTYSVESGLANSISSNDISDASFEDIKWMSKSILINYECKGLDQIIFQKVSKRELIQLCRRATLKSEDILNVLCFDKLLKDTFFSDTEEIIVYKILRNADTLEGKWNCSHKEICFGWFKKNFTFHQIESHINECDALNEPSVCIWDHLVDSDSDGKRAIIESIERGFKVMAFASIPYLRPKPISKNKKLVQKISRKGEKFPTTGGIFRIVNLPKEILLAEKRKPSTKEGVSLKNGRVGFIRYYQHERFTSMRGQWSFIPPIPDKDGNLPKVAYRVRKPKTGSKALTTSNK